MAHEFDLTLTVQDTGETVSLSGTFSDNDWKCLEDFVQYADELINTKLVQTGISASFSIHVDVTSGLVASAQLPPWDDVIVFLHKFRPLGLQKESTYFGKICNILSKELAHPYFRSIIDEQRALFSGKILQAQFLVRSNDVVLNSEKVLYDWLNAYEYHRIKEKQAFIDSLHVMLPLDVSKAMFMHLLDDKAEAIYNLAALIEVVLGKQKYVEGRMKRPE